MTATPFLSVEGMSITTPEGGRLVENAAFALDRAEIALLVGPSGSGKSTIINILGGLAGYGDARWTVTGQLECDGRRVDLGRDRGDVGGLVFQGNALFDDLSAADNLRIAADHAPTRDAELLRQAAALLSDILPDQPIAACSGGQQQRLGIARTILADRPVLLFDEPNSGLDKRAARRLAAMIRQLCQVMGKPAIIVAHHFDDLLPLADKVLFLDPGSRTLRHLPPDRDAAEAAILSLGHAGDDFTPAGAAPADSWTRIGQRRRHWQAYYLLEYLWILCAAPLMLAYIAAGGVIVGFVGTWFGFNYDVLGDYVKSLVHDDALMGIGLIQATVAVPLIACILMVARNNAIITADLGNRVLSSQMRAMRNLHIPGRAYLIGAILTSSVLGSIVLLAVALAASSWSAYATWQFLFPGQPFELWQENFFRALSRTPTALGQHLMWIAVKVVPSVAVSAAIAIAAGLRRQTSVIAINFAIAQSIVLGVSVTLVVHALVSIFQF